MRLPHLEYADDWDSLNNRALARNVVQHRTWLATTSLRDANPVGRSGRTWRVRWVSAHFVLRHGLTQIQSCFGQPDGSIIPFLYRAAAVTLSHSLRQIGAMSRELGRGPRPVDATWDAKNQSSGRAKRWLGADGHQMLRQSYCANRIRCLR